MSQGISLLLLRPQLLMSSLHQLIILTALRVAGVPTDVEIDNLSLARIGTSISHDLASTLAVNQEVFDKVRGLENKLEYQIKKLAGLAEAAETQEVVEPENGKPSCDLAN
jgi:U3 small nucleolar ribonucleoprotein protein LCP5